jgi:type II secretory pathway component PulM
MTGQDEAADAHRHVQFQLTEDDLIRANLGVLRWRQRQPKARLIFWGSAAATLLIALNASRPNTPLSVGLVVLIFGILLTVIFKLFQWFQQFEVKRRVRKTFAQHRSLHHMMDVEWNDADICFAARDSHARRPWEDHVAWSLDEHVVAVFATDNLYHPIPTRALTAEQSQDLVGHLSRAGVPRR